jgi:hypothetical protein
MVTPLDLFGRPGAEEKLAPPTEPTRPASMSALVIEVAPEHGDAYEQRAGTVLKVFPSQPGHAHVRIGIRHDRARAETRLTPARLRELAADLLARADYLDPPGGTS